MKRPAIAVLLCLLLTGFRVDGPTGIQFFGGSWNDALREAQRQNKPLFVDFYTTWCPPCRRMAREAFPDPRVGEKFNTRFINCQVDAERGEGIDLARRYAVASYPTALYITPTGEVVHRAVGYGGVSAMLQQADLVLAMPKVRRLFARRNRPRFDSPTPRNRLDSTETSDSTRTDRLP